MVGPGPVEGARFVRGPRDRIYRGYLVRENPWLQLQIAVALKRIKTT